MARGEENILKRISKLERHVSCLAKEDALGGVDLTQEIADRQAGDSALALVDTQLDQRITNLENDPHLDFNTLPPLP